MSSPLGEVLLKFRVNTAPLDQSLAKMKTKIAKFASSIKIETNGISFFRDLEGGLKKTARSFGKELADQVKKGISKAKGPTADAVSRVASYAGSKAKSATKTAYNAARDKMSQRYLEAYANKSKMDSIYNAHRSRYQKSKEEIKKYQDFIEKTRARIDVRNQARSNPYITQQDKDTIRQMNKVARRRIRMAKIAIAGESSQMDQAREGMSSIWAKRQRATGSYRKAAFGKGAVDLVGDAAVKAQSIMSSVFSKVKSDAGPTFKQVGLMVASTVTSTAKIGLGFISWLNPLGIVLNLFDGILNLGMNLVSVAFNIGKNLLVAASYAGIALVGVAGYFTKIAGEEEASITNIIRVAGIGIDMADKLRGSLLSVSSRSGGVSVGEVNKLAEFGARMGVGEGLSEKGKTEALAKFAADLSEIRMALDDIPVEEAATKISRILNVFEIGIDKTSNFASALVKLDNASTATGRDILEITRRISGTGSAMGITVQETMALAAAMRDVGIDIEVGGTSIQNFFVRMSSDIDNFAKTLKLPKEELKNLIDTKPMEAMRMVLSRLSQYSARDQATLFTKLHLQGQRMTSTIWQLVKGFGKFDELLGHSVREWESLESIEEAVEMKNKTLWVSMQKVWNQMNELGIEIGTRLLPIAKELVAGLGDLIAAFTRVARANKFFEDFSREVTSYIRMVRVLASDTSFAMSYMSAMWEEAVDSIGNALGWVSSVIQKSFNYIMEVMGRSLTWLGQRIKSPAQALGELIGTSIIEGLKNTIKGMIGFDVNKIVLDQIERTNAPEAIKMIFRAVAKEQADGSEVINKAQEKLDKALGGMFDNKAFDDLKNAMPKFPNFGTIEEDKEARKLALSISKNPADREKLKLWNEREKQVKENADFKRMEMFVRTNRFNQAENEAAKPLARVKNPMDIAIEAAKVANKTKADLIVPKDITKQAHKIMENTISNIGDIFDSEMTEKSQERMFSTETWKYREASADFYPIWDKRYRKKKEGQRASDANHQTLEEYSFTKKILSRSSVEKIEAAKEAAKKVADNSDLMKKYGYVPGMKGDKNAEAFREFQKAGGFMPSKQMSRLAAQGRAVVANEASEKATGTVIAKAVEEKMGESKIGAFGTGMGIMGGAFGIAETARKIKEDIAGKATPRIPTAKLDDLRDKDYKPEFVGLEEFSRKIQTGIFDKKNEDPQMRAANTLENMAKEQKNWANNQGKKMAEDVGALAQMGRDGQLGGLLTA